MKKNFIGKNKIDNNIIIEKNLDLNLDDKISCESIKSEKVSEIKMKYQKRKIKFIFQRVKNMKIWNMMKP